jgi:hypothetical protein
MQGWAQPGVLGFGLLVDRNIGVGIFPELQGIFIRLARRGLALIAVKPAIRGSPTYSQSFTARLKSCPDTKQRFSAACLAPHLPETDSPR